MQEFLDRESSYGARAIAITVSTTVGKQLQRLLLKNANWSSVAGHTVSLSGSINNIQFDIN